MADVTVRFRVEGRSMYPEVRDGDVIAVARIAPEAIRRGDVLLCRHARRVLAHRVVAVDGRGWSQLITLQGDANGSPDAPVPTTHVIGKVLSTSRNGRTISLGNPIARLRHRIRTAACRVKSLVVAWPLEQLAAIGAPWLEPTSGTMAPLPAGWKGRGR